MKVKEVWVADDDSERRNVIRRNEEEARKDAHDREAIVASLREALEDRLESAGINEEWARDLADLDRLTSVDVEKDGKRFRIRSTTQGRAGKVPQAIGGAVPPTVTQLAQLADS